MTKSTANIEGTRLSIINEWSNRKNVVLVAPIIDMLEGVTEEWSTHTADGVVSISIDRALDFKFTVIHVYSNDDGLRIIVKTFPTTETSITFSVTVDTSIEDIITFMRSVFPPEG